jgi:hypothetical protein
MSDTTTREEEIDREIDKVPISNLLICDIICLTIFCGYSGLIQFNNNNNSNSNLLQVYTFHLLLPF